MNHRELEKEGVDLKLVLLLLLKKISHVIIAALAGAVICGGIYAVWHGVLMGKRQYEAQSKYYITFEETMEKSYLDYYYNGYTWNDLLSSDPILGYAMTLLPEGYDRSYVDDCVEAEILSDVRVLTTTVKADTPEEVVLIQEVLEEAVEHYGTVGDKLEQIKVIRSDEPQLEELTNSVVRAAVTGAVAFAVLTVLCLLFRIAVQDAVYLPEEFTARYAIPVAGLRLRGQTENGETRTAQSESGAEQADAVKKKYAALQERLSKELTENISHLTKEKSYSTVSMQEVTDASEEIFATWRGQDGVILEFPQGEVNSKKLAHAMQRLELQDCPVIGAVMTDADPTFVSRYYGF